MLGPSPPIHGVQARRVLLRNWRQVAILQNTADSEPSGLAHGCDGRIPDTHSCPQFPGAADTVERYAVSADEGRNAAGRQADRIPFRPFLVRNEPNVNTTVPARSASAPGLGGGKPQPAPSPEYATRTSWRARRLAR